VTINGVLYWWEWAIFVFMWYKVATVRRLH
jgi:hypothetical protein